MIKTLTTILDTMEGHQTPTEIIDAFLAAPEGEGHAPISPGQRVLLEEILSRPEETDTDQLFVELIGKTDMVGISLMTYLARRVREHTDFLEAKERNGVLDIPAIVM